MTICLAKLLCTSVILSLRQFSSIFDQHVREQFIFHWNDVATIVRLKWGNSAACVSYVTQRCPFKKLTFNTIRVNMDHTTWDRTVDSPPSILLSAKSTVLNVILLPFYEVTSKIAWVISIYILNFELLLLINICHIKFLFHSKYNRIIIHYSFVSTEIIINS